ncbi:MAG: hypothetical protein PHW46_04570, partial [Candidatus Omnitrophica bacterium]|nr:hypothetical protein [Candidatus Omnitrophota bacterium]
RKLGKHYVGYGNGLKNVGIFMELSKLFISYEKQIDGRIKTDAWLDLSKMFDDDHGWFLTDGEPRGKPLVLAQALDPAALRAKEAAQRKALREKVSALARIKKAVLLFHSNIEKESASLSSDRKFLYETALKATERIMNDDFRSLEYYSEESLNEIAVNQSFEEIFEAIVYEDVISQEAWDEDRLADGAMLVYLSARLHELFSLPSEFSYKEKGENLLFYGAEEGASPYLRAVYDKEGNEISTFEYDKKTRALTFLSTLNLETGEKIQCRRVSDIEYAIHIGEQKKGTLHVWQPQDPVKNNNEDSTLYPLQISLHLDWQLHKKGIGVSVLNALMFAADGKAYVYDDNVFNPAMFRISNRACKDLELLCNNEWVLVSENRGAYRFLNEFVLVDPKLRYRDYEIRPYLDSGTERTGPPILNFRVMAYYSELLKKIFFRIRVEGKEEERLEEKFIFIHPTNGKEITIFIEKNTITLKYTNGALVRDLGVFYKEPLTVVMTPDPILMFKAREGSIQWYKAGSRIRIIPPEKQEANIFAQAKEAKEKNQRSSGPGKASQEEKSEKEREEPCVFSLAIPLDLSFRNEIVSIAENKGIEIIPLPDLAGESLIRALEEELNVRGKRTICMLLDREAMEEMAILSPDGAISKDSLASVLDTFIIENGINWMREQRVHGEKQFLGMAKLFVKTLPRIKSNSLDEKSLYEIAVDNIHRRCGTGEHTATPEEKERLLSSFLGEKNNFMSIAVQSPADMRLLANVMEDVGISKQLASKTLHIRMLDKEIGRENLDRYLAMTGLGEYIDNKNISICSGEETINDVLEKMKMLFGENITSCGKIVIGATKTLVKDEGDLDVLNKNENVFYLEMAEEENNKTGLVTQLFFNMMAFIRADEMADWTKNAIKPSKKHQRWYFYYPPIDENIWQEIKPEIDRYNRYVYSKA